MIQTERAEKIGFIGIGQMGQAMAGRLLKAGYGLTIYNRTPEKLQALAALGAHPALRPADVCHGVVITMLADDHATEAVVFGEHGLLKNSAAGTIHIAMSTISPAMSERLAAAHAEAGQHFLAAPVFGRPEAAEAGKLFIVAAGAAEIFETCAPIFNAMGQKSIHVAETPETANLVKLSGNFLIAAILQALGEATTFVDKAGVDPLQYIELLTSTLFGAPLFKTYGNLIARQHFQPAGFTVELGEKDLRYVLAAAKKLHVEMPLANLAHHRFQALKSAGGGQLDWSAVGRQPAPESGEKGN